MSFNRAKIEHSEATDIAIFPTNVLFSLNNTIYNITLQTLKKVA